MVEPIALVAVFGIGVMELIILLSGALCLGGLIAVVVVVLLVATQGNRPK